MIADAVDTVPAWLVLVSFDCFVFSTCVGRLQQCRVSEGKADGPRDWVANMDRDIKARSGGRERINVYPSAISTRNGTGAFEYTENSTRARLYGKRLIDHFLQRSRRIMRVRTRTHTLAGTLSNGGLCLLGNPHRLWGNTYLLFPIHPDNDANFDF